MKVKYFDKTLIIDSKSVELPFFIKDIIELEKIVIVLLDDQESLPLDSRLLDRNVYAFDNNANELWRIQPCPHGGERPKPYMLIHKNEKNEIIVNNYIGGDYILNIDNGEISLYSVGQRPW